MKKLLTLSVVLCLSVAVIGCGEEKKEVKKAGSSTTTTTTTTAK